MINLEKNDFSNQKPEFRETISVCEQESLNDEIKNKMLHIRLMIQHLKDELEDLEYVQVYGINAQAWHKMHGNLQYNLEQMENVEASYEYVYPEILAQILKEEEELDFYYPARKRKMIRG